MFRTGLFLVGLSGLGWVTWPTIDPHVKKVLPTATLTISATEPQAEPPAPPIPKQPNRIQVIDSQPLAGTWEKSPDWRIIVVKDTRTNREYMIVANDKVGATTTQLSP